MLFKRKDQDTRVDRLADAAPPDRKAGGGSKTPSIDWDKAARDEITALFGDDDLPAGPDLSSGRFDEDLEATRRAVAERQALLNPDETDWDLAAREEITALLGDEEAAGEADEDLEAIRRAIAARKARGGAAAASGAPAAPGAGTASRESAPDAGPDEASDEASDDTLPGIPPPLAPPAPADLPLTEADLDAEAEQRDGRLGWLVDFIDDDAPRALAEVPAPGPDAGAPSESESIADLDATLSEIDLALSDLDAAMPATRPRNRDEETAGPGDETRPLPAWDTLQDDEEGDLDVAGLAAAAADDADDADVSEVFMYRAVDDEEDDADVDTVVHAPFGEAPLNGRNTAPEPPAEPPAQAPAADEPSAGPAPHEAPSGDDTAASGDDPFDDVFGDLDDDPDPFKTAAAGPAVDPFDVTGGATDEPEASDDGPPAASTPSPALPAFDEEDDDEPFDLGAFAEAASRTDPFADVDDDEEEALGAALNVDRFDADGFDDDPFESAAFDYDTGDELGGDTAGGFGDDDFETAFPDPSGDEASDDPRLFSGAGPFNGDGYPDGDLDLPRARYDEAPEDDFMPPEPPSAAPSIDASIDTEADWPDFSDLDAPDPATSPFEDTGASPFAGLDFDVTNMGGPQKSGLTGSDEARPGGAGSAEPDSEAPDFEAPAPDTGPPEADDPDPFSTFASDDIDFMAPEPPVQPPARPEPRPEAEQAAADKAAQREEVRAKRAKEEEEEDFAVDLNAIRLKDRVVGMLLRRKIVTLRQVQEAQRIKEKEDSRENLWRILAAVRGVDRPAIFAEAARVYAFPTADVEGKLDPKFARSVMETLSEENRDRLLTLKLVPFECETEQQSGAVKLVFITHDPTRLDVQRAMKELKLDRFDLYYAPESAVDELIADAFPRKNEFLARIKEDERPVDLGMSYEEVDLVDEDLLEAEISRSSLINLFEATLIEAVRHQASDVHIYPNAQKRVEIHFRIDGRLSLWHTETKVHPEALLAVIKDNAMNVDRFERDAAQDGFIQRWIDDALIRFRVSVLPIANATQEIRSESIVIRVLDDRKVITDLRELGLLERAMGKFEQAIRQPHGMVILTGPTGSGKSTTLVAALHNVITPEVNVLTVEDPVEYIIPGVRQIKLNYKLELEDALRAILRHDPDIVMVGEMRDRKTAELAIKLANTGHLTFSTLHTNDAPSAISRLYKMGIEPFLIAYAINLVVAQRLIRKLCPVCKVEDPDPDDVMLQQLGFSDEEIATTTFYEPGTDDNCRSCKGIGYKGRRAISEALYFSRKVRHLIVESEGMINEEVIRDQAVKEGMFTLRDSAREIVKMGQTSVREMIRVVTTES